MANIHMDVVDGSYSTVDVEAVDENKVSHSLKKSQSFIGGPGSSYMMM